MVQKAGSPLVVEDVVIVSLSGNLVAYDATSGEPLWSGPDGGNSYSSPHLVTIGGVLQVLLMSKTGVVSIEPKSGKQLWTSIEMRLNFNDFIIHK